MLCGKLSAFPLSPMTNPGLEWRCWWSLLHAALEVNIHALGQECISRAEGCCFVHVLWYQRIHSHSAPSRTCPELGPTTIFCRELARSGFKHSCKGSHTKSPGLRARAQSHQLVIYFQAAQPIPMLVVLWALRATPSWPMKIRINIFG